MQFILIVGAFASLALVRSSPLQTEEQKSFCEFFKNVETNQKDLWGSCLDIVKATAEQEVKSLSSDTEHQEGVTLLEDFLSRGKAITQASAVADQMEYVKEFTRCIHETPALKTNRHKVKELDKNYVDFNAAMYDVSLKYDLKIKASAEELKQKLSEETASREQELINILDRFAKTYPAIQTDTIGSRILAFKEGHRCAEIDML